MARRLPPVRLSTLITAERTPPPISGGSLTVQADGKLAVIADPDRDVVYLVEHRHAADVRTVALAKGSEPGRVVLDAHGSAHVALRNAGAVVRIDLANAEVTAETKTCSLPRGVAYDADQDALLVACSDGQLVSLSAADHAELSRTLRRVRSARRAGQQDRRALGLALPQRRAVARQRRRQRSAWQTGPKSSRATRFDAVESKEGDATSHRPRAT